MNNASRHILVYYLLSKKIRDLSKVVVSKSCVCRSSLGGLSAGFTALNCYLKKKKKIKIEYLMRLFLL